MEIGVKGSSVVDRCRTGLWNCATRTGCRHPVQIDLAEEPGLARRCWGSARWSWPNRSACALHVGRNSGRAWRAASPPLPQEPSAEHNERHDDDGSTSFPGVAVAGGALNPRRHPRRARAHGDRPDERRARPFGTADSAWPSWTRPRSRARSGDS